MGNFKKEASRKVRQGKTGDGMGNIKIKGENFYRSAKKVKVLNMLKDGKPQRNAEGKITKAASYQSRDIPKARVEPNRKWFSNTRVIGQSTLAAFREAVAETAKDPHQVLLKTNKLPMSLIRDAAGPNTTNGVKQHRAKIALEGSPFAEVFGPRAQRKRVKLTANTLDDLVDEAEKGLDTYQDKLEQARLLSGNSGFEGGTDVVAEYESQISTAKEPIFNKGQSKRIWNELYKVIDSSDVVIHVLDARDPLGTRCRSVEKYLRQEAPHKHLIFVLNKCDLVPTGVAASWVRLLSKEYPTLAFHSSITNPFGKGSLIQLLRQFSILHSDRKQISVGFIGYPNTGKSSIINTLRKKKVCTVAPIPGETKVWQYITLMKRIYLIDCPGVVPPNQNDTPQDILLRGVVRVEHVEHPEQYIPAVLDKVKRHHMERTYAVTGWWGEGPNGRPDHVRFLELIARKSGRLLRGGEPDLDGVAKTVLNDFMRGRIPWFTPAPAPADGGDESRKDVIEGREGRLGEMPRKRKRDDVAAEERDNSLPATSMGASTPPGIDAAGEDVEFDGFGSEDDADVAVEAVADGAESEDVEDDVISLGVSSDDESASDDDESAVQHDVDSARASEAESRKMKTRPRLSD